MASCDQMNLPRASSRKRKRSTGATATATATATINGDFTLKSKKNESSADAKNRVTSDRLSNTRKDSNNVNSRDLLNIFTKDIRYQTSSLFDYERIQQFLLSATMAAATTANIFPSENEFNAYYQVLADMRVVKYIFDLDETIRSYYAVPIWRASIVGEYVYFPSEDKWIFVNAFIDYPTNVIDCDYSQRHSVYECYPSAANLPSSKRVPKVRYCAHRSHTPSSNFADVVHREPIRESWDILIKKLIDLKKQTERNAGRRW